MRRSAARMLFGAGVFLLLVHTTLPALWQVLGLSGPYPLAATKGILIAASGFTPPLGVTLMLCAGFVYGAKGEASAE